VTPFAWTGQPGRVVFGAGSVARLPAELERLGATRALVLSTPGRRASAEAIAATLGARAAGGLLALAKAVGARTTLRAIGMPADGLDRAADLAVRNPYWNPRPVERDAVRALLQAAFDGTAP
jgi:maleylacetate reductase